MSSRLKYKPCKPHGGGKGTAGINGIDGTPDHRPILTAEQKEELGGYDFPFENIVFEGGGNKGVSTTGAIRVLEELGYWGNITRFAGASAGAMVAALVAVGYNSHDIETFLCGDIQTVFLDAKFGILSLLPNMVTGYGWHPGHRIREWFKEKLRFQTGKPDLTFEQLYELPGENGKPSHRELCITVTNLNSMDCTYCHVKTTPDMPISQAVQMSACIPGIFFPVKVKTKSHNNYYVDGGLLCNYPIHCYDGWFLSMKPDDSFLQRLQPLGTLSKLWDHRERFGAKKGKTVGVLLYSAFEKELMKEELQGRFKKQIAQSEGQEYPDTSLARGCTDQLKEQEDKVDEHNVLVEAMSRFIKVLKQFDIDCNGAISLGEFEKAMGQKDSEFTEKDKRRLFGDNFSDTKKLFKDLNTRGREDGEITFRELVSFAEKQGLEIMEQFRGYGRQDIIGLRSYFGTIVNSLLLNMKRIFVQSSDVKCTIGIDTGYLDTLDFDMKPRDQSYIVVQGKLGCIAFLRELIKEKGMVRKT